MIIRRITLTNFGIYSQENSFDLSPQPEDGFNRPIILFKGKNGVGKTTLMEAIRLCLHGPLALGSRVSRADYEVHLAKRISVPTNLQNKPTATKIGLEMEYVSVGRRHIYLIERSWRDVNGKIKEELTILEDGQSPVDISTPHQKEGFLRELVPPSIAEIFFFDGEKLQILANGETSQYLLADTIKTLLGLHLVEQLQKDLDIYLARQETSSGLKALQGQLEKISRDRENLEQKRFELQGKQWEIHQAIHSIEQKITHQEQKFATQGSSFAERLGDLKVTKQRLITEIETQRKSAQELANGLLPFAISPKMLEAVTARLNREQAYEQASVAQQVIDKSYEYVESKFQQPDFLAMLGININGETLIKLLTEIKATMAHSIDISSITSDEVILDVSEKDRQTLLSWIEQALTDIPQQFCRVITRLNRLEAELEQVNQDLTLVPSDETLQPLAKTLQQYNQDLGAHRKVEQDLVEQLEQIGFKLEQATHQLRAIHQQMADHDQHDQRIRLASKTHLVLEDYAKALNEEKIVLLEQTVTRRFNDLNRKVGLFEAIKIDPNTFKITLSRQQQSFDRSQLSAGENQILAIAIIWALREVSGVPMPVILDTPIGRLDTEHRRRIIEEYFPRASHQIILLVTDAEIDSSMEEKLTPLISHSYDLTHRLASPTSLPSYPYRNGRVTQTRMVTDEAITYETK